MFKDCFDILKSVFNQNISFCQSSVILKAFYDRNGLSELSPLKLMMADEHMYGSIFEKKVGILCSSPLLSIYYN